MWRFYPKSFPMLILAGFSLAVVPLIFALINNAVSIRELATKSQRAVFNAVQATQSSRQLIEQITSMERSVRQFSILADPQIFSVFESSHREFIDTVKRMRGLPLLTGQLRVLERMSEIENLLFTSVAGLRNQPRLVADLVDDYVSLGELARSLDVQGRESVQRETTAMQALSGEVNTFIYWQLVALIPVALFLVVGSTILILKPIRQIEDALKRLGDGDFQHPVNVAGPRDLEDLGRQIDWVRMRLMELEEQKTRFLHQVSHELKTPLSAIREGAELMADGAVGELQPAQVEVARILHENTLRLQRLIEDLLNFHTVQFQRSGIHLERVQLPAVIQRVADAHRLPMRAKDLRLNVSCPDIALQADENKLEVILDNLLSNAVKFSPPFGEIMISAQSRGQEVVLDVSDEGPGVAPGERERVFEPFYQGKARADASVKGTGLGLAIVREYVAAHGGRVEILDTHRQGAHFQVRLPAAVQ
jgi:two-component system, NtrC family, sensor histidine kinase GlrK